MDIAAILYALTIVHAGYLAQLNLRQPSSKIVTTQYESWVMWFVASPVATAFGRSLKLCVAVHHAIISLTHFNTPPNSNTALQSTCPTPDYLDPNLFTWSEYSIPSLILLYVGSYIRFQAYAQLGANFTYRLSKPDQLVTSGVYTHVRHPSYTGLILVFLAEYSLFFRQRGLTSCWAHLVGEKLVTDARVPYLVPVVGFTCVFWLFMMRRVQEEEVMMEKEFGQKWREYRARTKKFVPFVY